MDSKFKIINNATQISFFLSVYLLPAIAVADDNNVDFGQLLVNVSKSFPAIFSFLTGLTAVVGIAFILLAFFKLKHLADFRNMMSGQQELGKVFMLLVIGVIFLWMPYVIDVFTVTIFQKNDSILRADYPLAGSGAPTTFQIAFFNLAKLIGLMSFIKGWFILSGMAKGQAQPGTVGKALTHMISGLLLFHLSATMGILEKTLGHKFFNVS